MKSSYEILGVRRNASQDEIKKAYKELAKKYHPDKYNDNPLKELAESKMREINAAYDELTKTGSSSAFGGQNTSGAYGGQRAQYTYTYRASNAYSGGNPYSSSGGNPYSNSGGNPYSGGGGANGSYNPFGTNKKWPRHYYVIIAVVILMTFVASYFYNNLMGDAYISNTDGNVYGNTEESYEYPSDGKEHPDSGATNNPSDDPVTNYVMTGALTGYPDVTISDAVNSYMSNVSWDSYTASNGQNIVEATGYVGSNRDGAFVLQFAVGNDGSIDLEWAGSSYDDEINEEQLEAVKAEVFGRSGGGTGSGSGSDGSGSGGSGSGGRRDAGSSDA